MPEIVPAYIGQTGAFQERLEVPVDDVLGVDGSSLARGEDESCVPVVRRSQLLFGLLHPLASEGFYGPLRELYGASAGVLRLAEHETAAFPHSLHLAGHS